MIRRSTEVSDPLDATPGSARLDMSQVRIDPVWALRVPANLAMRRQVLPFAEVDGVVHVACADVADAAALKAIERHIQRPLRPQAAERESLRRVLQRVFGDAPPLAGGTEDPTTLANEILFAAWLRVASDIHLDPGREHLRVRLRVDGVLEPYRDLPLSVHLELLSRVKVLAGMDVAERRAPQDGRFTYRFGQADVDIRVATLPTKYGERVTLRLLAIEMESLTLGNLGMCERDLVWYEQTIQMPHGLLLVTGPTGCGKTSTLCAALRRIVSTRNVNAITVQDPIEYDIPDVAQVEVNSDQKVTFVKALRSILRHDPDVLMIGEIRDRETADIAIEAALTGHLVLATLHANSAVAAVTRLVEMGIERYLITATLRLVVSQRLVRRLCPQCRQRSEPSDDDEEQVAGYEPRGCVYCAGRGYNGRIGLFELLAIDDEWRRAVSAGLDEVALRELQEERALATIIDDAFDKVDRGVTSLREVVAVTGMRRES